MANILDCVAIIAIFLINTKKIEKITINMSLCLLIEEL